MKLNLWHKSLLTSVAALSVVLAFYHNDYTISNFQSASSVADIQFQPESFHIRNGSGYSDSLFSPVAVTMQKVMRREGLRGGVSIAISLNGSVVYARGIGFSSLEDSITLEPYNVMRVASVSKLITAVAIMHLVEEGRLMLDQKVFGPIGVLNDDVYMTMRDRRMTEVTVRNLLDHSGGWHSTSGDPMFMPYVIAQETGAELPVDIEDIIRFMQGKKMHFYPSSYSVYSNFGYGILGEVVAKVSGMPYEDYVRSQVLAPLGIFDAHLGHSHKENRLPFETAYYEPDTTSLVPDYAERGRLSRRAYGGADIHTLGSAGGWVISSVDLLKLVLSIDGFASVPDQLSALSIAQMTDPNSRFDPLGWRKVIGGAWFRTGTLAATSAIVCRRPDGICFATIFNSSSGLGPHLAILIANQMNAAINSVIKSEKPWPKEDLLDTDETWQHYKLQGK